MAFTKLFYHVIWSTKNREPIITPEIEDRLHSFIAKKAIGLGGDRYGWGINDNPSLIGSQ